MSKSKALTTVPSFEVNIAHIRDYHAIAMNAANQAVAAAVFVGLELQKVKVAIKKSITGDTFDKWLEGHSDEIGFGRATAFRYMRLAENLKSKLLKEQDNSVVALLAKAPSELSASQAKTLLLSLHKSVEGQSLTELYEDYGIVRKPHKLTNPNPANNGDGKRDQVPDEETLIQEEFYLPLSELMDFTEKTVKRGKDSISRLALIPKDRWLTHRADLKALIAKGDLLHGIKEDK